MPGMPQIRQQTKEIKLKEKPKQTLNDIHQPKFI